MGLVDAVTAPALASAVMTAPAVMAAPAVMTVTTATILQLYTSTLHDIFVHQVLHLIDGMHNIQDIVTYLHSTLELVLQALSVTEVAGVVALLPPTSHTSVFTYGPTYQNALKTRTFAEQVMLYSTHRQYESIDAVDAALPVWFTQLYSCPSIVLANAVINSLATNQILPIDILVPNIAAVCSDVKGTAEGAQSPPTHQTPQYQSNIFTPTQHMRSHYTE
uniref:Nitrogen permease regulator 2-like protein n=2 Tax=Lygus hesperus TaxID=30085 RepID=A0A0A9WJJ4_LYGHE